MKKLVLLAFFCGIVSAARVDADPVIFSTGNPDGQLAAASRPSSAGKFEIESADDFVLTDPTQITSASFTGLLTNVAMLSDIAEVRVEIYRVFPNDSNVGRTSGPPNFSTPMVPTRVNSPSDVEFADRDTASSNLTFTANVLNPNFTALNSIQPGGIHPMPGQTTGGNGPLTGTEVQFNVNFLTPFMLPADHYFFVPQVEVTDPSGNFYWLSAPRPIVPPGTPFPSGFTDLQAWTRDQFLTPDWLREGTDIVGGATPPTFNQVFSLSGTVSNGSVPDAGSTAALLGSTLFVLSCLTRRTRRAG